MPQMSKVELYAAIRRDHRDGMTMREISRKYNVSWRTIRKAVDSVWPCGADLDAPRKQRHTVTRIFHRLVEEHGAEVSYQQVRRYVADRKPQILVESGKGSIEAFVPQTHQPGMEAEVDFGDVTVKLAGEVVTCYLFSFCLSYSGKAVHRVFASCGQEAFFEGHVHALRTLGGVPRSKVRYDNLKAAVARVLGLRRARVEADRWIAFKSHFGIESFYCRPGIEGAHEKGGVEGQIGYFRRNHFVPVPDRVAGGAERAGRAVGPARRAAPDRSQGPDDRRVLRGRAPAAAAAAGGSVRDGAGVHSAGRPLRPNRSPHQPLLGAGPPDRQAGPGAAARLSPGGLRQERGGGPA